MPCTLKDTSLLEADQWSHNLQRDFESTLILEAFKKGPTCVTYPEVNI